MQLALKARGTRITDELRALAEHKSQKLPRWEPHVARCEIEFVQEAHRDGIKRVELAVDTPKKRFRARGEGLEFEPALDKALDRIERQMHDHRKRTRARVIQGANRLKSTTRRTERTQGTIPADAERP